MNDKRELLELAAKVAGVKIDKSPYNGCGGKNIGFDLAGNAVIDWHNGKIWNPLEDDGDALRLAVKLRLVIETDFNGGANAGNHALSFDEPEYAFQEGSGKPDPYAATRLAIVRVAAEIGRNMK